MFGKKKKDDKKDNGFLFSSMSHNDLAFSSLLSKQLENITLRTTIKTLEKEAEEAKKQSALTKKENADLKKRVASYAKDLEQFYLKAIGDCRTIKQVEVVLKRYHESELGFESQTKVGRAASTKIKRINTRDARQICTMLDTTTDRTLYASSMATTLKGIANIEVDRTRVLAAKDSGLDAWNVLLSMLSAYGINHDSVLEVK